MRSVLAYQRVGWLAPKKKPVTSVKPEPPSESIDRKGGGSS
jgi:hypothetical protein